MACVVYMTNKKSGHVYAYESVSYRDPVTKKPKSKRKYLGRVDPITKEFLKDTSEKKSKVPPGENQTSAASQPVVPRENPALVADVQKLEARVEQLEEQIATLTNALDETRNFLATVGQSFSLFKQ